MQSSYSAIAKKLFACSNKHFVHHGKWKIPPKVTNWWPMDLTKKGNKQTSAGDSVKNWPWALIYLYIYIYIYIYIYTHLFSKTLQFEKKNIWNVYKQKVYIFHVYFKILMFFENWCIYTVLIFLDHVVITCSSRCIPGDFRLNKLAIDYNQYLSTYLKQGKSAISWSSNSYKNIRKSIKINMNIHSIEGQEDQYSVELNSSFLTLAVSM